MMPFIDLTRYAMNPKKLIILVLLAMLGGSMLGLYGCNTVRGIGQDIEKAGDAIQRSSNQ